MSHHEPPPPPPPTKNKSLTSQPSEVDLGYPQLHGTIQEFKTNKAFENAN